MTDVLQMVRERQPWALNIISQAMTLFLQMGRAGRPGYDTHGVAVILCAADKKNFYQKFLYEPFPVESQLREQFADHLNAEIAGGSVRSRRDAVDFLTWTYLYRRISKNPAYYGVEDSSSAGIQLYLEDIVNESLEALEDSRCVLIGDDAAITHGASDAGLAGALAVRNAVAPSTLGRIASYYYLQHETAGLFMDQLGIVDPSPAGVLKLLGDSGKMVHPWSNRNDMHAVPNSICS